MTVINLTELEVQESRYEINKSISATNYIVKRWKEFNHIVLGVLPLRHFFVVCALCQTAVADARNAITNPYLKCLDYVTNQ